MRTTFHKLFWIWQLPKEEAWINEMAEHGYGVVSTGRFTYEFENIENGKYKYKVLFLKGSFGSEKIREFLRFMEEMDVFNVGHVSYPGHTVVYLRYDSSMEDFDVYSDLDSKIEYERALVSYLLIAAIINLIAWILNMTIFITNCLRGYPSFVSLACALNLVLAVIVIKNIVKRVNRINEYKAEREIHE
jgi:hypothetical protein